MAVGKITDEIWMQFFHSAGVRDKSRGSPSWRAVTKLFQFLDWLQHINTNGLSLYTFHTKQLPIYDIECICIHSLENEIRHMSMLLTLYV